MTNNQFSRRDCLKLLGAGAAASASDLSHHACFGSCAHQALLTRPDRARRMKWWHEAKFGMFIHWGLYSVLGRHEWVMEMEGIPVS
jgi:alpha-L-fucosidase